MLRAAGEVADGVHVHPFHSMKFIEEVLLPNVAEGARKAGRRPEHMARWKTMLAELKALTR